jgi:predicted ABC-type ATPase
VPTLTILAGPNGSGKSSFRAEVEFEGREESLDPDAIAVEINPSDPAAAAFAAGREMLRRIDAAFEACRSFSIETTLSSRQSLDALKQGRERGYVVRLIFVALDTPEHSIARIAIRAKRGRHFIPDEDVRRRYARSLKNLPEALRLAHGAEVYENTGTAHRLVLTATNGVITWRSETAPAWVPESL